MDLLLKLEEVFLLALSIFLFRDLGLAWWIYPVFFFGSDLGILGYLGGPVTGAMTYNVLHHRGLAAALYIAGAFLAAPLMQAAGLLILGHSSFDRALGYGLKYPDAFQHTHLGWIGRQTGP